MDSWVTVTDIKDFGYMLKTHSPDRGEDGYKTFGEVVDILAADGLVLAVVDELLPFESGNEDVSSKSLLHSGLIAISAIMPQLLISNVRKRYASVIFCRAEANDPDLKVLERVGIEVMDSKEALAFIKDASLDEQQLTLFYDVVHADAYRSSVHWISQLICRGITSEYLHRRDDGVDQDNLDAWQMKTSIVGELDALLLGIPARPDLTLLDDVERLRNVRRLNAYARVVFSEYGQRDESERALLRQIDSAWAQIFPSCAKAYCDAHPQQTPPIEIPVEEIINLMMLDHAKEAYDAGVPIEDIIC